MYTRFRFLALLGLLLFATGVGAQSAASVTRAEVLMFLYVTSNRSPGAHPLGAIATDVPANHPQATYLAAGQAAGLIEPELETGKLHPEGSVSRGEYLRMLTLFFGLPTSPPRRFVDIPSSAPYAFAIGIAEQCALFSSANSRLEPMKTLTHTEAASTLQKLFACLPSLRPSQQHFISLPLPGTTTPPKSSSSPSTIGTSVSTDRATARPIFPLQNSYELRKTETIALVNHERMNAGLLPLIRSSALEQAAQAHAKDMYKRGYFSHFSPEGLSYVDRIRASGYLTLPPTLCPCKALIDMRSLLENRSETTPHYVITRAKTVCNCTPRFALGENIARGQQTADIAVKQWMASPSHRQAILQPLFRETGVGVFGDVWVQEFGSLTLE